MPVYLLHGFRWPRPLIRIHIILQNLDDAAAEWLMAPATVECLLENFEELYPQAMANLPDLRFIEQYDPLDESPNAGSQPYAYVADVVHEVRLGTAVDEATGKGIPGKQWDALLHIRDKLAPDEKVGWYVVVCGDEERLANDDGAEEESLSEEEGEEIALPYMPSPKHARIFLPQPGEGFASRIRSAPGRPRTSESTARSASTATDSTVRSTTARTDSAFGKLIAEQRLGRETGPPGSRGSVDSSDINTESPQRRQNGFTKLVGSLKKRASQATVKGHRSGISDEKDSTMPPVPQSRSKGTKGKKR